MVDMVSRRCLTRWLGMFKGASPSSIAQRRTDSEWKTNRRLLKLSLINVNNKFVLLCIVDQKRRARGGCLASLHCAFFFLPSVGAPCRILLAAHARRTLPARRRMLSARPTRRKSDTHKKRERRLRLPRAKRGSGKVGQGQSRRGHRCVTRPRASPDHPTW